MIDRYSQKFSLDPNIVFKSATFDDITIFLLKWKTEAEFNDAYMELEKQLNTLNDRA